MRLHELHGPAQCARQQVVVGREKRHVVRRNPFNFLIIGAYVTDNRGVADNGYLGSSPVRAAATSGVLSGNASSIINTRTLTSDWLRTLSTHSRGKRRSDNRGRLRLQSSRQNRPIF